MRLDVLESLCDLINERIKMNPIHRRHANQL